MKKEEDDTPKIKKRLETIAQSGVALYLDGKEVSPEEIAGLYAVCENMTYMPDYVTDEKGVLTEVRYDKVSTE